MMGEVSPVSKEVEDARPLASELVERGADVPPPSRRGASRNVARVVKNMHSLEP